MYLGVKPSIPGVELYACFVDVELYTGPPCSALVSFRVRVLAARQLVYRSLQGRAERVIKGHTGATGAQLSMASSIAGSGIGVWDQMDELVAADPSLTALRDDCAKALIMSKSVNTTAAYKGHVGKWQLVASSSSCSVQCHTMYV